MIDLLFNINMNLILNLLISLSNHLLLDMWRYRTQENLQAQFYMKSLAGWQKKNKAEIQAESTYVSWVDLKEPELFFQIAKTHGESYTNMWGANFPIPRFFTPRIFFTPSPWYETNWDLWALQKQWRPFKLHWRLGPLDMCR